MFAGTGAIVVNQASGNVLGHAGIALTFGMVVVSMIYTFGDVSGAHFNPAVSLAFAVAGRFPLKAVPAYIAAQCSGALSASALLAWLIPRHGSLGATLPSGTPLQSLAFEMVLTLILMLVILSVSTGASEKGITAGLAIGCTVGLEAMFAGPICGASMNPARSLGPALISGMLDHLWVYLAGPFLGALLAVPLCRVCRENVPSS